MELEDVAELGQRWTVFAAPAGNAGPRRGGSLSMRVIPPTASRPAAELLPREMVAEYWDPGLVARRASDVGVVARGETATRETSSFSTKPKVVTGTWTVRVSGIV